MKASLFASQYFNSGHISTGLGLVYSSISIACDVTELEIKKNVNLRAEVTKVSLISLEFDSQERERNKLNKTAKRLTSCALSRLLLF